MVEIGERKEGYGKRRQRHVDALHGATVEPTDDDSFLTRAVSRDSLPVGYQNLRVPPLLKTFKFLLAQYDSSAFRTRKTAKWNFQRQFLRNPYKSRT